MENLGKLCSFISALLMYQCVKHLWGYWGVGILFAVLLGVLALILQGFFD